MPSWSEIIFLSSLNQIVAIKLIEKGQIAEGLTILNNETTFYKHLLIGNDSLLDNVLTSFLLLKNYHIVEQLLDLPIMANELDNPLLLNLLTPLTAQEQRAASFALLKDRESIILTLALRKKSESAELYLAQDNIINAMLALLSYNKNKDLNNTYQVLQTSINEASIILPEASDFYLNTVNQHHINKPLSTTELIKIYGFDNILGGILIEASKNIDYRKYSYRFYAVPTYLALVTAKLAIKQAGISKQQVPAFLASLGKKAINPYTQKPFAWDEKKQILSTDWPERAPQPPNIGNKAQVYISFP